jgi:endoglucanase Acf2
MSLHDDVLSSSWFHNANENKNENESFNKSIDNENFNADRETYDILFAKRLAKELDKRSKECMLASEKIGLLELELKSVRTQLNSVLRVSSYNKSYNNNSIKHFHTINKVASNSIDNAAATVANLLVDELENTKNELEKCQKELSKSFKREQEYQTKLSSLYEELTNRTGVKRNCYYNYHHFYYNYHFYR